MQSVRQKLFDFFLWNRKKAHSAKYKRSTNLDRLDWGTFCGIFLCRDKKSYFDALFDIIIWTNIDIAAKFQSSQWKISMKKINK